MGVVVREVHRAADRLHLVAHDPATGRPRLGPRQLGLGLAAGLLGELLLGGLVQVTDDGLDLIRFSPAVSVYAALLRELVHQQTIAVDLGVGEG